MKIIDVKIKDLKPYERNPQKTKNIYQIYSIVNNKNNKFYIGQTKRNYRRRFKEHLCPHEGCPLLRKAIKKYGKENFECELLDIAYSQEEANIKEKMWIRLLKTYQPKNGYNLSMGGKIGDFNEQTLKKMSKSKKGVKNSFYGKKHTKEAKEKMSKWKKENYVLGKHPGAKKVKCVETGEIFNCAKEAELKLNINSRHIGQVANGKYGRKTAGGYHWIWEENV